MVALDPASGELRPFQDVMVRRRKYGITQAASDYSVSLFCLSCCTPTARTSPTCRTPSGRARLAEAIMPSARLRLATAEQVDDEAALERAFEQAVAEAAKR